MEMSPNATRALSAMFQARTGQQLSPARNWRVGLALSPFMQARGLCSLEAVAQLAASGNDPLLSTAVIEALLNHETSFFRDGAPFGSLTDTVLPRLAGARAGGVLRIWCAGCSTGQEAYSLAMAATTQLPGRPIEIVATDVSQAAIARARTGIYPQMEIQRGLPIRMMLRWFEEIGEGSWQAVPGLRGQVRFQTRNLLDVAPAGRFDLVLCRNVMLYFDAERRRIAFDRLADALRPDGLLMLGAGETVIGQTDRFVVEEGIRGFYRPVPVPRCLPPGLPDRAV